MNRKLLRVLIACFLFPVVVSSCVRTSTVVKVKDDGSGEIISRYYFSPRVLMMIDQIEAAGFQPGAAGQFADLALIREIVTPLQEDLVEDAENYGDGVRYEKHEAGKDAEGWEGYTVVYAFEDVNEVRIDQNTVPKKAKEFVEASGQVDEFESGGSLTFGLDGDVLSITSSLAEGNMKELVDKRQLDQAAAMGVTPSEAMRMAANSMRGMRAGVFVRIDGGIVETSAEHVTGNLIIMSDVEVSKVMEDPDFQDFLERAMKDPELLTEDSVKELFGKLEAMTMEMSEEVTVRMK